MVVKSLFKATGWPFSSPGEVHGTCLKFESQQNEAMPLLEGESVNN